MVEENKKLFLRLMQPLIVGFTYLFLYLPIIVMVLFSFNKTKVSVHWEGFSLCWYKQLFQTPEILDALQVSLIVALFATIISVVLGTLFVVASVWRKSGYLSYLFHANIILPEIIMAIGILSVFTFFQIPLGYLSLITGHTVIGLGFVIPIVRARFVELDPILTEASLDLGASYTHTFKKVLLPLLMPSLVSSALLVFTLSLDDFMIAFFCSGPKVQTLSVYVYSMIKGGVDPTINAISALFLLFSSLLVLILCSLRVIDQVMSHE
ncbi:MAG: Putrescine transport system permease protein potI [candidate division TM6 bacterium GW2011_GWF2_37_49]|nr:MAG: Putrescine transport system permease protein potI [candidate division TM6 bacterium GW2011_GWF2_37_49]